jgi:hypothetical protein
VNLPETKVINERSKEDIDERTNNGDEEGKSRHK